jgi:radical SAM enzyme (TIGR01210 family)
MTPAYPARDRTAWILAQRPPRSGAPDPEKPHGVFLEEERLASGEIVSSGVVLLTNKECPWRCLMCDLWKDTTLETVAAGAIPRQIDFARQSWAEAGALPRQVKLYNSGSFFDPAAIPPEDYAAIAAKVAFAENVVVESHPRLVGERTQRFRDLLDGSLEVAMGLETAHPEVLERLNKNFDLAQFSRAADFLRAEGIALRVFLLVNPPFLDEAEGAAWIVKSAESAFACGASAVSLILTRTGNGAMERLLASGEFVPPTLGTLENAMRAVLALGRGRVFADTWGLEPFSTCPHCLVARQQRLRAINLTQREHPAIVCAACDSAEPRS